jgi:hypothetical protein
VISYERRKRGQAASRAAASLISTREPIPMAKALALLGNLIPSPADARGDHIVRHAFGETAQQLFLARAERWIAHRYTRTTRLPYLPCPQRVRGLPQHHPPIMICGRPATSIGRIHRIGTGGAPIGSFPYGSRSMRHRGEKTVERHYWGKRKLAVDRRCQRSIAQHNKSEQKLCAPFTLGETLALQIGADGGYSRLRS